MALQRKNAQIEEMRTRGFIMVSEAAERALLHPGAIYRALEAGRLRGTQVGERKYVEWKSFVAYAGILGKDASIGQIERPIRAEAKKRAPAGKPAAKKRPAHRSRA